MRYLNNIVIERMINNIARFSALTFFKILENRYYRYLKNSYAIY